MADPAEGPANWRSLSSLPNFKKDRKVRMHKKLLSLISISLLLAGCAKGAGAFQVTLQESSLSNGSQATPENPEPSNPDLPPPNSNTGSDPSFCGPLDFRGVIWPSALELPERKALGLSLSISGSFEGNSGWSNLSNNFDGQGISLGLLQQNLGTGSLQPLLWKMRANSPAALKSYFTSEDYSSLEGMLLQWNSSSATMAKVSSQESDELFPAQEHLSDLDFADPGVIRSEAVTTMGVAETASVAWAKANLFSDGGTTFIPRWKTSLQKMALSSNYRSIQVESAIKLFAKAEAYFDAFHFTEMRSLLLMYDFVVQNGGFSQSHKDQFAAYDKANPNATETQRALKLLEIRLVSVLAQYKDDVRSRKSTIINNTGTVHGKARNLSQEFCFVPSENLRPLTLP